MTDEEIKQFLINNKLEFIRIEKNKQKSLDHIYFKLNNCIVYINRNSISKLPNYQFQNRNFVNPEDFIFFLKLKLSKIHNNYFTYDNFNFKSVRDLITITCPIHGDFELLYTNHLQGKGCIICSLKKVSERFAASQEHFIDKSQLVHGNRYDYSLVKYDRTFLKVTIKCSLHGNFEQIAAVHLRGGGCPKCGDNSATEKKLKNSIAGWDRSSYCGNYKESIIYLLKIIVKNQIFYKIGMTVNIEYRCNQLSLNISKVYKALVKINVLYFKKMSSWDTYDLEKELHKEFKDKRVKLNRKFNGYTECFNIVDFSKFIKIVNNF